MLEQHCYKYAKCNIFRPILHAVPVSPAACYFCLSPTCFDVLILLFCFEFCDTEWLKTVSKESSDIQMLLKYVQNLTFCLDINFDVNMTVTQKCVFRKILHTGFKWYPNHMDDVHINSKMSVYVTGLCNARAEWKFRDIWIQPLHLWRTWSQGILGYLFMATQSTYWQTTLSHTTSDSWFWVLFLYKNQM